MVALVFANDDLRLGLTAAIGLGFIIVILSMSVGYIAWRRLTYRIGTDDIRVESGILSRAARSVPFERIQDVSLEQGLVPRLLGLVEVRFETGAGGKDELKLAFLTEAEGEALRETVRIRNSGPADPASTEALSKADEPQATRTAPPLFAMDNRRLLTFGLFEFSLAVVAVFAGAAQQFDFLLPFDLWDFDGWQDRLAGPGAWLQGLGFAAQAAGAVVAAATLIVVGMTTGFIRTFTRDWDFRLEETDRGFRRRRGLFTRTDVVMPKHRVQAVQVTTGVVRRFFGWHGLKFISLAQDAGSASHVVAPFARTSEMTPIAETAGFSLPVDAAGNTEWRRSSARYRVDQALIEFGLLLLVSAFLAASLWFEAEEATVRAILLAIAPFAAVTLAVRQWLLWQRERHSIDLHQIYNRTGLFAPTLNVASRIKLQSAEIVQGPIARRRGYATLHLGLAGGKFAIRGIELDRAHALRRGILSSIRSRDFSALMQG
ncbi:PH domain-containing protein [Altererythrobacter sp. SALINAS58]|nr:PH domain-containing protein [Alteripontixanthobacter muriae]